MDGKFSALPRNHYDSPMTTPLHGFLPTPGPPPAFHLESAGGGGSFYAKRVILDSSGAIVAYLIPVAQTQKPGSRVVRLPIGAKPGGDITQTFLDSLPGRKFTVMALGTSGDPANLGWTTTIISWSNAEPTAVGKYILVTLAETPPGPLFLGAGFNRSDHIWIWLEEPVDVPVQPDPIPDDPSTRPDAPPDGTDAPFTNSQDYARTDFGLIPLIVRENIYGDFADRSTAPPEFKVIDKGAAGLLGATVADEAVASIAQAVSQDDVDKLKIPSAKVYKTPRGQLLILQDTEGTSRILIQGFKDHENYILIDTEEDFIEIKDVSGDYIKIESTPLKITVQDAGGDSIVLNGKSGEITITATAKVTVTAPAGIFLN